MLAGGRGRCDVVAADVRVQCDGAGVVAAAAVVGGVVWCGRRPRLRRRWPASWAEVLTPTDALTQVRSVIALEPRPGKAPRLDLLDLTSFQVIFQTLYRFESHFGFHFVLDHVLDRILLNYIVMHTINS